MLKLRAGFIFFSIETIMTVFGLGCFIYTVFNNPEDRMTQTGVLFGIFIVVAAAIACAVKLIWRSKHTLKFNTKQFVVNGVTYDYDRIEKVDMHTVINKTGNIYIFVDGKEVFCFTKRYQNFWEFKAVLKEHGIELTYY